MPLSAEHPLRVLVVDDNDFSAKILVKWIEKKGHSAVVVADGQKAVGVGLRESWDLILMDLQMPRMDGLTATRLLRAGGRGALAPIVALTASSLEDEKERCRAAGMRAMLTKPVSFERLAELLDELNRERAQGG